MVFRSHGTFLLGSLLQNETPLLEHFFTSCESTCLNQVKFLWKSISISQSTSERMLILKINKSYSFYCWNPCITSLPILEFLPLASTSNRTGSPKKVIVSCSSQFSIVINMSPGRSIFFLKIRTSFLADLKLQGRKTKVQGTQWVWWIHVLSHLNLSAQWSI